MVQGGITRFRFKVLSEEEKFEQIQHQLWKFVAQSPVQVQVERQKKGPGRPPKVFQQVERQKKGPGRPPKVFQHADVLDQSMQLSNNEEAGAEDIVKLGRGMDTRKFCLVSLRRPQAEAFLSRLKTVNERSILEKESWDMLRLKQRNPGPPETQIPRST
ncbi:hypothetical protein R1sor_016181 [Riccia sorocarpa]|uniref:Uncharacterized protein n=1 Tax=Riccia sorocarpa TaxID=122646 RepID=A0ABD3HH16_9MARC